MKLVFNKKELNDGINKVQKAVSNKTTLPILECILIDATKAEINLISSDGELFIKTKVEGEIVEKGSVAIDSKQLSDIIRKMPEDEDIIINVDENKTCIIKSGNIELKVFGKDENNFPPFPSFSKDIEVNIDEFTFKNVINKTIFSVAIGGLNKTITGESFEFEKNILKVIAIDGCRVAIRKIILDKEYNKMKFIIPAKALNEVSRIIEGENENIIHIYFSKNNISFMTKNCEIVTPVINGEIVDLKRIINEDYTTKVVVNKKELYDTLDRCTIFANEKKPVILDIKENIINVKLQSLSGEYKDDVNVKKSGNDLMIGFNTKLLLDALRVIDEEVVNLYFTNSKLPCYITDKIDNGTNEDYSYLYLILPTNLVQK